MAYDPNRDSCATCIYFIADPEDPSAGDCRRYPPVYQARLHVCAFVTVTAENTCGEFDSLLSDDHAKSHCH